MTGAKEIVEAVKDEEEEAYDNLPEGVQESERGEAIQENVDSLESIADDIDTLDSDTGDKIDEIQEVIDR